jgi:hypothetical protein
MGRIDDVEQTRTKQIGLSRGGLAKAGSHFARFLRGRGLNLAKS